MKISYLRVVLQVVCFGSTDGGQSWNLTNNPGQLHNVTCVAQDTRVGKEDTWYFGIGENRGGWLGDVSFLGNGIYKSTDGGMSWDSLHITTSNTPQADDSDFDFVWNIVTDPSNDSMDVLYALHMATFIKVRMVV